MVMMLAVALLGQYTNEISIGFAREVALAPPLPLNRKFKVSIFNGTKKSVTLLAENCSWGYDMISFETKDPAGHLYSITRKQKGWDKNYPMPVVVESTDLIVRAINFTDGTWQGLPAGVAGNLDGWSIRVKLVVKADRLFAYGSFWTGSIASKFTPVIVRAN
jgi:hypothetical protein